MTTAEAKLVKTHGDGRTELHWVGVFDPDLRVFDIVMRTPYGTSYNSFLLRTASGKTVLFETAKEAFVKEFMERILSVIGTEGKIDYIVLNHTEPDHSGSLSHLLERYPDAQIFATRAALLNLEHIAHGTSASAALARATCVQRGPRSPKSDTELCLGDITVEFYVAPLLHWPDTMFSYIREMRVLVTCDFFGAHYYNTKVFSDAITTDPAATAALWDAYKYYFDCIFGPFKPAVLSGLAIVDTLVVDVVCCSHGPVLRNEIPRYVAAYREWAQPPRREDRAVVAYVSAYKYTRDLAVAISKGLEANGVKATLFDMVDSKLDEVMASLETAKGLVVGTPTIVGEALPPIFDIVTRINPIIHGGLVLGTFGSYGWSGEGTRNVQGRLDQLAPRCMVPLEPLAVRFKPTTKDLNNATEWACKIARAVKGESVNERRSKVAVAPASTGASRVRQLLAPATAALPSDGRLRRWKCIVCGEIVVSVLPPQVCRACGAGAEAFVCVGLAADPAVEAAAASAAAPAMHVVIVGSGAAAVSALKAIREKNAGAQITVVSKEVHRPYYRPSLSKLLSEPALLKADDFYLLPLSWFDDNHVAFLPDHTVAFADVTKRTLSVVDNKTQAKHELSYDRLILATGGGCFVPFPAESIASCHNVFTLRTLDDALQLRAFIGEKSVKRAAVVGGGLSALEVAQALLQMGVAHIDVVECLSRILPKQLSEEASALYKKALEQQGVALHLGQQCKELLRNGDAASGLLLAGNERVEADLVCVAIGTRCDTELARAAGIACGRGIKVNARMETSAPSVFACGDCAEFDGACVPNWTEATAQGRVAGLQAVDAATDGSDEFQRRASPYALSAFEQIFSVGDIALRESLAYRRDGCLLQLFFREGNLAGAVVVGAAAAKKLQAPLDAAVNLTPPLSAAEASQFIGAL
eukprot:TRINITY_DN16933_c0_g1_i1.p1 TRINITY_DN16933_c0_g1~~TRINITY_DN16933_c0_g1_i1.p1  ORF type:complete len:927 (+),score=244.36 TRINITY_DN16933_c0_g1_i1:66-2846(+)